MGLPLWSGRETGAWRVADIFDEAESDYHAEQLRAAVSRYGWVAAAAVVLGLLAVGGFEYWQSRTAHADQRAAAAYLDDSKQADALVAGDRAGQLALAQRFTNLAATAPPGYRTLARLRAAGLLADAGKLSAAQALWDQLSSDPNTDPLLRQLASLLWVQRGLATSDPAALRTRLVTQMSADDPYHALAAEAQALLDLRLHNPDGARAVLESLLADPTLPSGVRARDGAILTMLGGR